MRRSDERKKRMKLRTKSNFLQKEYFKSLYTEFKSGDSRGKAFEGEWAFESTPDTRELVINLFRRQIAELGEIILFIDVMIQFLQSSVAASAGER